MRTYYSCHVANVMTFSGIWEGGWGQTTLQLNLLTCCKLKVSQNDEAIQGLRKNIIISCMKNKY